MMSEEQKKKISIATLEAMKRPEVHARLVLSHIGLKQSEESKIKKGVTLKKWYLENRDTEKQKVRSKKISKALKGRTLIELHGVEHANEIKKKMSNSLKGRIVSEETKKKISVANKNNIQLSNSLKRYFKEVGVSSITREKLSKAGMGKKFPKEKYPNFGFRGKTITDEHKESISKNMKENNPMKNIETRAKMGMSVKKKWDESIEYRRKIIESRGVSPNKAEKYLIGLIKNHNLPLEFCGNGTKWFTAKNNARFNPDFIDAGNKIIVELFGEYWHKTLGREENDYSRILTYKRAGYRVLIVWDKELENEKEVIKKLKELYVQNG